MNVLNNEEIARRAPSALTIGQAVELSDKYKAFATSVVIDALTAEGWMPTTAKQSASRKADGSVYAKHMIRLTHRSSLDRTVGTVLPQLVLTNSHNGTSAMKIEGGLFRLVCSNGLVIDSACLQRATVRHFGAHNSMESVMAAALGIARAMPQVIDTVTKMEQLIVDEEVSLEMARNAAALRWDNPDLDAARLLVRRRVEDRKQSLWTIYNVLQENLIRGGARYRSQKDRSRVNTVREVKSVDEEMRINRGLWRLAEDMLFGVRE